MYSKSLGPEEIRAVTSFLYNNVKPFADKKSVISNERLQELVKCCELRFVQPQQGTTETLCARSPVSRTPTSPSPRVRARL